MIYTFAKTTLQL